MYVHIVGGQHWLLGLPKQTTILNRIFSVTHCLELHNYIYIWTFLLSPCHFKKCTRLLNWRILRWRKYIQHLSRVMLSNPNTILLLRTLLCFFGWLQLDTPINSTKPITNDGQPSSLRHFTISKANNSINAHGSTPRLNCMYITCHKLFLYVFSVSSLPHKRPKKLWFKCILDLCMNFGQFHLSIWRTLDYKTT